MNIVIAILGMVCGYLLGSISNAILISNLMGLPDPRTQGSNNPGATNVLRIGGKLPAVLTLIGDMLKGLLPVLLIQLFTQEYFIISAVLLATVAGHVYPIFFNFKGGKGVATLIGGLAALSPMLCLIYLATWLLVFIPSRLSSLSALIATTTMPIWAWILIDHQAFPCLLLTAIFVIWRHRSNIRALWAKTEDKSTF